MTHVDECCENCGRELREGRDGLDLCADCAERDTTAQARRNEIENAQHGMEKRGDARLAGDVLDPVKRMSIGELRRDALDYRDRHVAACVHELAQRLARTEADLAAARAEAERLWDELAACKHERDCAVSSICQRLAQAEADAQRLDWLERLLEPGAQLRIERDSSGVLHLWQPDEFGADGDTLRAAIDQAIEEGR